MESPIVKRAIEIVKDGYFELYNNNINLLDEEQIYVGLYRLFESYIHSYNFSLFSDKNVFYAYNFCEVMMKIEKSPTYMKLKDKGLEKAFIQNPICFTDKISLCLYFLRKFEPTIFYSSKGKTRYKLKKCKNMKELLEKSENFAIACDTLNILKRKQKSKITKKDGIWMENINDYSSEIVSFRDVLKILEEIN